MIFGVGIDLVSSKRINAVMLQFKDKFAKKIFTKNEIDFSEKIASEKKRILFYAKRFAAKEAFAKALGLGIGRGIDFTDIQIENDDLGKPQIKILNGKEKFLKLHLSCESFVIHLSITDQLDSAAAIVIIEKN